MERDSKKSKVSLAVIIILVIVLLGIIAFTGYTYVKKDIDGKDGNAAEYTLNIESADFQYQVAQKLVSGKIILNDTIWCYWMDKHYPDFTFINGEYHMNGSMSYEDIAQKLMKPDISHKTVSVCVPEGYNVFDIADLLEESGVCSRQDFLEACKRKADYDYTFLETVSDADNVAYQLEGFLFPATYDLGENTPAKEVVDTMLDTFDARLRNSWIDFCNENSLTLGELISLASVVEKETLGSGVAENISSVFFNRLEIGQKLQSDVTIFYGNALRENGFDDEIVTAYNTYKCDGLPAGAICNPGAANIDAVVNHNDTDYFYFFSDLENEFHFAKDYNEFEKLKKEFPWQD